MKKSSCRGASGLGLMMALALPLGAQVVPDGSTSTTVTVGANGSVTVGLAPTGGNGASLNRYDTLNVPKAGVALDNRTVAARTIVNEVTGTGTTTIVGPVEVLGQRAHVIVANPNGIVVDAGRFINTGRVALTTGQIGTESRQIAPGVFQDNVTATVTGGRITIAGGGLSGQMEAVDLIAHDLVVRGAVKGSEVATDAGIMLYAGSSKTEFDSAVLPGNSGLGWARVTGAGAQNDGAVLVDISVDGALRSNQIGIVVNDLGAGVRFAGDAFATARSFSIDASGAVTVVQGQIAARGGVSVSGAHIDISKARVAASESVISVVATQGGITLKESEFAARDITLTAPGDLAFSGTTLNATGSLGFDAKGDMVLNNSQLRAAGHLMLSAKGARLENSAEGPQSELVAENGALVASLSGDLTVKGGLVQGGTKADGLTNAAGLESAGAVTIDAAHNIEISNTAATGIIFGAGGDTVIHAGGSLTVDQARIISNGDLRIDVAEDLINWMGAEAAAGGNVIRTTSSKRIWWTLGLLRKKVTTLRYASSAEYAVPVLQASGAISLTAKRVLNQGGEINANGGALDIRARLIENAAVRQGDMLLNQSCLVICVTKVSGTSRASGGTLNAAGDTNLSAEDTITSTGGTILTLGDLSLDAPYVYIGAIRLPTVVERPRGIYSMWQRSGWLSQPLTGGAVTARGKIDIATQSPVELSGGSIVAGDGVTNPAGETVLKLPGADTGATAKNVGLFRAIPLIEN